MLRIDALYLLLLVEALVLMTALSLYLLYRMRTYRKMMKGGNEEKEGVKKLIERQRDEKLEQVKMVSEEERSNPENMILRELQSSRLQLMNTVLEGLGKRGENHGVLWETFCRAFEEIVKGILRDKRELLSEIDKFRTASKETDDSGEEIRELKAGASGQEKRIADLLLYKELFAESQRRLDAIHRNSKGLREKLVVIAEDAGVSESMKESLDSLDRNNKELQLCVDVLEKENDRLPKKISMWQAELQKVWQEKDEGEAVVQGEYGKIREEKELLKAKTRELEETIEKKDREIAALQKKFESLEAEYMVLYKEKMGQGPAS
jgi:prefoldin subunit 5